MQKKSSTKPTDNELNEALVELAGVSLPVMPGVLRSMRTGYELVGAWPAFYFEDMDDPDDDVRNQAIAQALDVVIRYARAADTGRPT